MSFTSYPIYPYFNNQNSQNSPMGMDMGMEIGIGIGMGQSNLPIKTEILSVPIKSEGFPVPMTPFPLNCLKQEQYQLNRRKNSLSKNNNNNKSNTYKNRSRQNYNNNKSNGIHMSAKKKNNNKNDSGINIQLMSKWDDDFMSDQIMMNSMKHSPSDLLAISSMAWGNILGINKQTITNNNKNNNSSGGGGGGGGGGGQKRKKGNGWINSSKKSKCKYQKPIPREERVFLRCPKCQDRVHVRHMCCPHCGLSKADSKKRKAFIAK